MTCPLIGDCYIECRHESGCHKTIINAQSQNGSFELLCEDNINICGEIKVFGSTLLSNIGSQFLVTCGHRVGVCRNGMINCALGMDCQVNCHRKDDTQLPKGRTSCQDVTINGPIDHRLRVECDTPFACRSAIINAKDSSALQLTCTDIKSCCNSNIYKPKRPLSDYRYINILCIHSIYIFKYLSIKLIHINLYIAKSIMHHRI